MLTQFCCVYDVMFPILSATTTGDGEQYNDEIIECGFIDVK